MTDNAWKYGIVPPNPPSMIALYMVSPPNPVTPYVPPPQPTPLNPAPVVLQAHDPRLDEVLTLLSALTLEVRRLADLIELNTPKRPAKRK